MRFAYLAGSVLHRQFKFLLIWHLESDSQDSFISELTESDRAIWAAFSGLASAKQANQVLRWSVNCNSAVCFALIVDNSPA